MASVKISALPAVPVAPALADIFPEVQPAVGGTTYKATFQELLTLFEANIVVTSTNFSGVLAPDKGGTGVNNGVSTFTIGGNFSMVGAFTFAGTLTGNTAVTFPTSGTLATTTGIPSVPLTTKGDLLTFTTVNARLPVGTVNGQFLQVNSGTATGLAWSTATIPATANNVARILRSDGTNWAQTTATFADSYGASEFLYSNGANNVAGLVTAINGLPVTGNTGIPVILVGPGVTGKVLTSNAAAAPSWSTPTYPATAGSAANVLTSDGTNWTSAAPAGSATSVIVDDTTTNATMYPTWVTAATGSLPLKVSSTKLSFNPSTAVLTLTGALSSSTGIISSAGLNLATYTYTASAVNYLNFANAATGSGTLTGSPTIGTAGSDANVPLQFSSKLGYFFLTDSSSTNSARLYFFNAAKTFATYLQVATAAGADLALTLPSGDGSLNWPLVTSGAGVLSFRQTPTFSAWASGATTLTAASFTKVLFATEEWDVGGYFASSRFTPLVAGTYDINALVSLTGTNVVATSQYVACLFFNGAQIKNGTTAVAEVSGVYGSLLSCKVQMNGSTDYIEIYFYNENAATALTTANTQVGTYFQGVWVAPLA